jgi:succinate-acetate transporter protein
LFFLLTTTFFILGIGTCSWWQCFCRGNPLNIDTTGFLNKKVNIIKIGGFCGIATALIAYYCGLAEMLTENDIFTLPTGKHTPRN